MHYIKEGHMVAIGYARRSKESGAKTVSLDEQAEQIRRYTAQQGWPWRRW